MYFCNSLFIFGDKSSGAPDDKNVLRDSWDIVEDAEQEEGNASKLHYRDGAAYVI
jgi:hypothetical protein